jgi:hypothetical protein
LLLRRHKESLRIEVAEGAMDEGDKIATQQAA